MFRFVWPFRLPLMTVLSHFFAVQTIVGQPLSHYPAQSQLYLGNPCHTPICSPNYSWATPVTLLCSPNYSWATPVTLLYAVPTIVGQSQSHFYAFPIIVWQSLSHYHAKSQLYFYCKGGNPVSALGKLVALAPGKNNCSPHLEVAFRPYVSSDLHISV